MSGRRWWLVTVTMVKSACRGSLEPACPSADHENLQVESIDRAGWGLNLSPPGWFGLITQAPSASAKLPL
eukprot:1155602-Pelagomonas_calceolata.AAC.2